MSDNDGYFRRRADDHLRMAGRAPAPYIARIHEELARRYLLRVAGAVLIVRRVSAGRLGRRVFHVHPPRVPR